MIILHSPSFFSSFFPSSSIKLGKMNTMVVIDLRNCRPFISLCIIINEKVTSNVTLEVTFL
jgi:hypothetical protein